MDNEAKLKALRARISSAQQEEARADVARDSAVSARTKALESLHTQFGASTVEEAESLLASLRVDLAADIEKIESTLQELGA